MLARLEDGAVAVATFPLDGSARCSLAKLRNASEKTVAIGEAMIQATVACTGVLASLFASGSDGEGTARARAWATIIQVRDESVRTMESHDVVWVHPTEGEPIRMLEYDVVSDDLRNLYMNGEMCLVGSAGYQCNPLVFSLRNGVVRAMDSYHNVAVVRPERPDRITPWGYPGPFQGLGRFVNMMQLRSRADHLFGCADLAVDESAPDRVVLTGTGRLDHRLFRHRVEVDPTTGDVLRHQVYDLSWNYLFVEWRNVSWVEMNGVRVPDHSEYRVFSPDIDTALLAQIREECEEAGIPAESISPDHPRYAEWVRIRDDVVGVEVPVVLGCPWQSSESDFRSVNKRLSSAAFDLPPKFRPDAVLSGALECEVDQLELEPTSAGGVNESADAGDSR